MLKTNVRKKVHKRAEQVNSDTYDFVYNRDKGRCVICGSNDMILHTPEFLKRTKTNNMEFKVWTCIISN